MELKVWYPHGLDACLIVELWIVCFFMMWTFILSTVCSPCGICSFKYSPPIHLDIIKLIQLRFFFSHSLSLKFGVTGGLHRENTSKWVGELDVEVRTTEALWYWWLISRWDRTWLNRLLKVSSLWKNFVLTSVFMIYGEFSYKKILLNFIFLQIVFYFRCARPAQLAVSFDL